MRRAGLSKSKIMSGLQCPRRLWLEVHRPELVCYGPAQQFLFRQGDAVGEQARRRYPDGILIEAEAGRGGLRTALARTSALLDGNADVTLFEATFSVDGILVRADLLHRRAGRCRMTEVKSSTKVKDAQVLDAAVQTWVLGRAGVPLERVGLMILDRGFVYGGDGDYAGLLVEHEVTDAVTSHLPGLPVQVDALRRMLEGPLPSHPVGPSCSSPYDCPLLEHCCTAAAEYHVACLPRGLALAEELQADGICDLRQIPPGRLSNPDHLRIWNATRAGAAAVDPRIGERLRALAYPRFHLDFETVSRAVPVWRGTRAWDAIPFQFSLHVEREGGALEHAEFLDLSGDDPRRACAERLLAALGGSDGPVLMYTPFELHRLRDLAAACPDLAPRLRGVEARLVDLHPIVKQHYYHPQQRGSWSIKAVLPTVAPGLAYDDLEGVHEGGEAEAAYLEAVDPATSGERREALRSQLLRYCERDTLAMVRLARHFQAL